MSVNHTITMSTMFCKYYTSVDMQRNIRHDPCDAPQNLYGFLLMDAQMNHR